MSSFNCQICLTPQIDSEHGYISGCDHYPPEKPGNYKVKIMPKDMAPGGGWYEDIKSFDGQNWDLSWFQEVYQWEII